MTAAVGVISFAAGGVRFALAAADVSDLDDAAAATADATPLAALLALPSTAGPGAPRVLTVTAAGARRAVIVDGPLRVHTVTVAQVVPSPAGWARPPVLGWARVDDQLVQLLDAASLCAAEARP